MTAQPTGTVTLLFTDVEGSTRLLEWLGPERYAELLELHRTLLRAAFERHGGYEFGTEGDAIFVAFARAEDAVAAAAAGQRALASADWPYGVEVRVRMGVHTGEPLPVETDYVGMDVHRVARITSAGHGGQVLVSEATAALLDGTPLRELGRHRLKDLLEPIGLDQLVVEGLPDEFPPLRSLRRTNLPLAAWPLLGRARELAEIHDLIAEGARLVTLTGPGGSGKTRLALQAGAELSEEFPDGVFFVALAPLRETRAVHPAAAEAVGLQPDDDVVAWLATKRLLLLLDNLEHLDGVAAAASELLVGEVVVLATSRAPLHLSAEREVPVEPLPGDAAVELFVSRAAAAGRGVEADETVAAVCRRLDNLPLALELAAARAKLLSPAALLERLDAVLPLLAGGAIDLPERQRTLRATIEWSHDLLDPGAQAAFRRLSVFRGSFTLRAAEAIADADLDQLEALLDQSLLKPLGDERFFQLETLREYARERLDEAAETEDYALRHARHYLARLEEIEPVLRGPRTGEFLDWYAAEEDNLRAMLDRLTEPAPDEATRAAFLLTPYWIARGALDEGRERLNALLAGEASSDLSRASLFERLCDVEERLGNLDAAQAAGEEAVRLATVTDTRATLVGALRGLAWTASRREEVDEAIRLGTRASEEARELDDEHRLTCQHDLGTFLTNAGRYEEARAFLLEAAEGYRRRGDTANEANALVNLGNLDFIAGDYESARRTYVQASEKARQVEYGATAHFASISIGQALVALGRQDEARVVFAESLAGAVNPDLTVNSATKPSLGLVLSGIALACPPELFPQAARLRSAVVRLRREGEVFHDFHDEEFFNRFDQHLLEALGEETWEWEKTAGALLTLEETIELARSLCDYEEEASPTD